MAENDRATEEWKIEALQKISRAAAGLGFNTLFVPAKSRLCTRRQVALGLIEVLIKEYELGNEVR